MTIQTRISSKGQLVIPKEIRRAMKLPVGARFTVIRQDDDIILRRDKEKSGLSMADLLAAAQDVSAPFRPKMPLTIEEIRGVSEDALRKHFGNRPK